jgi:hypothetical protein
MGGLVSALHPAQLHAARGRMVALATALASEDTELIGVAVDGMEPMEAVHALCYTLGAFCQVWQDYAADEDGETWIEFLQRTALPRRD